MLSKAEENKLREALKRTFLEGYPNPERRGCPGAGVLKAVASGKLTLEEAEPWINHLSSCSPCTREFAQLRSEHQRHALRLVASVAAGVILAVAVSAWLFVQGPLGPARIQPVTVDLSNWVALRGPEENAANPPVQLAKGNLNLTVYLPAGSQPGLYDVQVVRAPGQPIWTAQREAKLDNLKTTVQVQVDLRQFSPGLYKLAFRRQGRSWTYIPLVLK